MTYNTFSNWLNERDSSIIEEMKVPGWLKGAMAGSALTAGGMHMMNRPSEPTKMVQTQAMPSVKEAPPKEAPLNWDNAIRIDDIPDSVEDGKFIIMTGSVEVEVDNQKDVGRAKDMGVKRAELKASSNIMKMLGVKHIDTLGQMVGEPTYKMIGPNTMKVEAKFKFSKKALGIN